MGVSQIVVRRVVKRAVERGLGGWGMRSFLGVGVMVVVGGGIAGVGG